MSHAQTDLPQEIKSKVVEVCERARGQLGIEVAALCRRYVRYADQIWHCVEGMTGLRRGGEEHETRPQARQAPREVRAGTYIGPYRVMKALGRGGMGAVYLAEQTEPVKRLVAVKVIRAGIDIDQVLSRFALERQALAVMNHPAIARVYEAGESSEGAPYFVMEYVPGVPIDEYCETKKLSLTDRLVLLQMVCAGVQHAHQKGVIHRDLTARNVLVTEEEGRPVPKIIDFGLARATDLELAQRSLCTEAGLVVGTPEFMSPEQIDPSQDIDTRTDVYSLGVLLFSILTGSLPFPSEVLRAGGFAELQRMIVEQDPPRPSFVVEMLSAEAAAELALRRQTTVHHLLQHLRTDLDWVALKCLEKDRNQRYATPNELSTEIGRYLHDEPLVAGPPSAGYRLRKMLRRNKRRVAALAAVALVLVAGMLGTTHGLISAKANAAVAEANAAQAHAEKLEADRQRERANQNALNLQRQSERLQHQTVLALALRQLGIDPWLSLAFVREVPATSPLAGETLQVALDALSACDGAWRCQARLLGHEGRITALDLHPDGGRILTAARDGTVRLWRGSSDVVLPHPDEVVLARFTPGGLGVLTACRDGVLRLWGTSGSDRPVCLPRDARLPESLVFDPNGERFVTVSAEGLARLWDVRRPGSDAPAVGSDVRLAAFSSDSRRLLLLGFNEVVRVLRADGDGKVREVRHDAPVLHAEFGPDGSRIVTASRDQTVRLTPLEGGSAPIVLAHPTAVRWASFASGGTVVVSLGEDDVVRVWSAHTGTPIASHGQPDRAVRSVVVGESGALALVGADHTVRVCQQGQTADVALRHEAQVEQVLFLGRGEHVLTLAADGRARVWDLASPRSPRVLEHPGGVERVAAHRDGRRIVTAAGTGTARVWECGGAVEPRAFRKDGGVATVLAWSPDQARLAIGGEDGRIAVFDGATGAVLATLQAHERHVRCLDFSPDGKMLASGAEDGSVRCTSLEGAWPAQALSGHDAAVVGVRFSPDGELLATASHDGTARVWRRDGTSEPRVLRAHRWCVSALCFSPDGASLATASWDGSVLLWPLHREGEDPAVLRHPDKVHAVAFSADGTQVATACEDGNARVFGVTGAAAPVRLAGHTRAVRCVAFSPDGSQLVTASPDHTVRVWPTDGSHEPTVLRGHADDVVAVAFAPDSARVISASADGTARIWSLVSEARPLVLRHAGGLAAAAFTADGTAALTLAADGARIWQLEWPTLRQWLHDHVALSLSELERGSFQLETVVPAQPPR